MSVLKSDQFVEGADLETPTWVTSYQGLPRTVNVRRCRLEVVAGVDQGKVVELASPTIQIGRLGADLTLSDGKVSSLHCELRMTPEGYRLRDLGSTNGTYVKGVRVVDGFIAPVSAWISTVASDCANRLISSNRWRIPALPPIRLWKRASFHSGIAPASSISENTSALLPTWIVAPGAMKPSTTRTPLTYVPFVEPRSRSR